jgi:hypothetical protein
MEKNIWELAYNNTKSIRLNISFKAICKNCNCVTDYKSTEHRQVLGNCFEVIVECNECKQYFIESFKYN